MTTRIRTVMLVADQPSPAGRIYPREVLAKMVEKAQPAIKERTLFGMMGASEANESSAAVSLRRVSHVVTRMELGKDGCLDADIEPLDTEFGRMLGHAFEHTAMIGRGDLFPYRFAPSGIGSTKVRADGLEVVQDDYRLRSVDVVMKEPEAARQKYPWEP